MTERDNSITGRFFGLYSGSWRKQLAIYGSTALVTLTFALVSDFHYGRPKEVILWQSFSLIFFLMVVLPLGFFFTPPLLHREILWLITHVVAEKSLGKHKFYKRWLRIRRGRDLGIARVKPLTLPVHQFTLPPSESALRAAHAMWLFATDIIYVTNRDDTIYGFVLAEDILKTVIKSHREPSDVRLFDIIRALESKYDLEEGPDPLYEFAEGAHSEHLPVFDHGKFLGVLYREEFIEENQAKDRLGISHFIGELHELD